MSPENMSFVLTQPANWLPELVVVVHAYWPLCHVDKAMAWYFAYYVCVVSSASCFVDPHSAMQPTLPLQLPQLG